LYFPETVGLIQPEGRTFWMSCRLYASSGSKTGEGVSKGHIRAEQSSPQRSADSNRIARAPVRQWTVGVCAPAASARIGPLPACHADRHGGRSDRLGRRAIGTEIGSALGAASGQSFP
jgi:hypothetical protein